MTSTAILLFFGQSKCPRIVQYRLNLAYGQPGTVGRHTPVAPSILALLLHLVILFFSAMLVLLAFALKPHPVTPRSFSFPDPCRSSLPLTHSSRFSLLGIFFFSLSPTCVGLHLDLFAFVALLARAAAVVRPNQARL